MKEITLAEYKRLVEEIHTEQTTWKQQEYLSETLYTKPNGQCLWESNNWWFDCEEIAKKQIRDEVWQTWVANIWTLRGILQMQTKRGGPNEDDIEYGYTPEYIEKMISGNFNMLSQIFGFTHEEIESGVNDYIAYRQSFEFLPSGSKERCEAVSNNKILLPEKGHKYAVDHPLK